MKISAKKNFLLTILALFHCNTTPYWEEHKKTCANPNARAANPEEMLHSAQLCLSRIQEPEKQFQNQQSLEIWKALLRAKKTAEAWLLRTFSCHGNKPSCSYRKKAIEMLYARPETIDQQAVRRVAVLKRLTKQTPEMGMQ